METSNVVASDEKTETSNGNGNENSAPKLCYSKELMMKLKNHPKSKERPQTFELLDMVSKSGMWDPEHWMTRTSSRDSKRPTPGTIAAMKDDQHEKKRKEEVDEFCFTPQRRSFVSGCHVVPSKRQESEPLPSTLPIETVRESTIPSRRVGSGRITGRELEPVLTNTKDLRERREPLRSTVQRERTFDRDPPSRNFPSRSDIRDKAPEKDRRNFDRTGYDRDYSRGNRYQDRRKNHDEDDTPEWFHGGPTSQHDTIELRGFDEEQDKAKTIKATSKRDVIKDRKQGTGKKEEEAPLVNGSSRSGSALSGSISKEEKSSSGDQRKKSPTPNDFNIEDFLKMDSDGIDGLGLGSSELDEKARGSKSSRWFSKAQEEAQTSAPEKSHSSKHDAARSLLEMLQQGTPQGPEHGKYLTAEELERSSGKTVSKERVVDDSMTVFNKLLAQVNDSVPKSQVVMGNAPTEQDILANLLGNKMKIDSHSQQNFPVAQQQPEQDALAKFLQQQHTNQILHQNQHHHHLMNQQQQPQLPFHMAEDQQQQKDVHSIMREVSNGLQGLQQMQMMSMQNQRHQQNHQQQNHHPYIGTPQQPPKTTSSSSPLSFTPTAVMRKMTAEKDKIKSSSLDKGDGVDPGVISTGPVVSSSSVSNRLTGRTASQVQGAARVSNQLGMNETPLPQQLTGRPLVKGQEGVPFQQPHMGNRPAVPPFNSQQLASNAAITGVAVKLFEQQQQHQLLAAAVAASAASQNQQLKQQQQLLQQRTSPLQQSLLAFTSGMQSSMGMQNRAIPPNVPVANRTHFRPIHPQPLIPPLSGYSPFMGNQNQSIQNRPVSGINSANQFYGGVPPVNNMRGQGINSMASLQQQVYAGNRSPNMMQGNPLARWFPPEIFSQAAAGQMSNLPPMPSQKILSLEELERLHTSPMSH